MICVLPVQGGLVPCGGVLLEGGQTAASPWALADRNNERQRYGPPSSTYGLYESGPRRRNTTVAHDVNTLWPAG